MATAQQQKQSRAEKQTAGGLWGLEDRRDDGGAVPVELENAGGDGRISLHSRCAETVGAGVGCSEGCPRDRRKVERAVGVDSRRNAEWLLESGEAGSLNPDTVIGVIYTVLEEHIEQRAW